MSDSSTRLPENEVGGHPQTGEGAIRKLGIADDVVAGDPRLMAALAAITPTPEPVIETPLSVPSQAELDAVVAAAVTTPTPDPAPLIPPVTPAAPQE